MASSSSWKLRALMKKNLLIMRRNPCSTAFEILFPIALILLCYIIRQAFQLEKFYFKEEETDIPTYITNTSVYYVKDAISPLISDVDATLGLSILPALKICSIMNDKYEPRPVIAVIGVPDDIKDRITDEAGSYGASVKFKEYNSIEEMENIVKDNAYGKDDEHELICFGIYFKKQGHKYDYSLHYFDSRFNNFTLKYYLYSQKKNDMKLIINKIQNHIIFYLIEQNNSGLIPEKINNGALNRISQR